MRVSPETATGMLSVVWPGWKVSEPEAASKSSPRWAPASMVVYSTVTGVVCTQLSVTGKVTVFVPAFPSVTEEPPWTVNTGVPWARSSRPSKKTSRAPLVPVRWPISRTRIQRVPGGSTPRVAAWYQDPLAGGMPES
jgi:hypothetical protein